MHRTGIFWHCVKEDGWMSNNNKRARHTPWLAIHSLPKQPKEVKVIPLLITLHTHMHVNEWMNVINSQRVKKLHRHISPPEKAPFFLLTYCTWKRETPFSAAVINIGHQYPPCPSLAHLSRPHCPPASAEKLLLNTSSTDLLSSVRNDRRQWDGILTQTRF